MARGVKSSVKDSALLSAALEGLEAQKLRVEEQIRQVQAMLGKRRGRPPAATKSKAKAAEKPAGRRKLSAAARKRIAIAQKKRWAEYHKKAPGAGKS